MRPKNLRLNSQKLVRITTFFLKLLLLLAIVIGLYFAFTKLFVITQLSCEFDNEPCPPSALAQLDRISGKSMINLDVTAIESKITNGSPLFESASLTPSLPAKAHLQITRSDVAAQITTATDSGALLISSTNNVVNFQSQPIPQLSKIVLNTPQDLNLGDPVVDPATLSALTLAKKLEEHHVRFSQISLTNPTNLSVMLTQGFSAVFDPSLDIDSKIDALVAILNQLPPEPISQIDLRYTRPVIRFVQ